MRPVRILVQEHMDPEEAEARRIEELRAKEEREIENMIVNKQVTHEDIDRLNEALRSNIKATEDLARFAIFLIFKLCWIKTN